MKYIALIEKGGAWFSYGDERIGQGRENSKTYLKENEEISLEIENKIRAKYNLPKVLKDINDKNLE